MPVGFAHGFCTLEPDTEVALQGLELRTHRLTTAACCWNDPDLGIAWPVAAADATLSDKDRKLPRLRDLPPLF